MKIASLVVSLAGVYFGAARHEEVIKELRRIGSCPGIAQQCPIPGSRLNKDTSKLIFDRTGIA
jgi:hypothetical protein